MPAERERHKNWRPASRPRLRTFDDSERVVVLANREPFRHERTPDGGIAVVRSASGLVTALEPLVEACRGVWVAHGAGSADRMVVDRCDGLNVPPATPLYRLRRVWLDDAEVCSCSASSPARRNS